MPADALARQAVNLVAGCEVDLARVAVRGALEDASVDAPGEIEQPCLGLLHRAMQRGVPRAAQLGTAARSRFSRAAMSRSTWTDSWVIAHGLRWMTSNAHMLLSCGHEERASQAALLRGRNGGACASAEDRLL